MEKQIIVTIDTVGRIEMDAKGYTGGECLEATKALEKALSGNGEVERTIKPEMNMGGKTQQQEQFRNW